MGLLLAFLPNRFMKCFRIVWYRHETLIAFLENDLQQSILIVRYHAVMIYGDVNCNFRPEVAVFNAQLMTGAHLGNRLFPSSFDYQQITEESDGHRFFIYTGKFEHDDDLIPRLVYIGGRTPRDCGTGWPGTK
jgi:hypothetical protein